MSWTVLHLKPRCEKKVAEFCRLGGISHYLPLRSETKVYQRRKVTTQLPLFPGYIFANINDQQRLSLLQTNNVLRTIAPPDPRQMLRELVFVRRALRVEPDLRVSPELKRGTGVQVIRGPFEGISGIVSCIRAKTRVMINIEMLGQAVVIETRGSDLELLPED